MNAIFIPDMEMPKDNDVVYIFSDGSAHKHILGMREIKERSKAVSVNVLTDPLTFADCIPVVHAYWLRVGETPHFYIDECSACHGRTIDARAYCTNCGAKMYEEVGE